LNSPLHHHHKNGILCLNLFSCFSDVDLIVTILAILKSGMAYLPIAPDWPKSRCLSKVKTRQDHTIHTGQDSTTKHMHFYNTLKLLSDYIIK
jgi:non-ribosomal peptide synthetase component F